MRRHVLLLERDAIEPRHVHPGARARLVRLELGEEQGVDGDAPRGCACVPREVLGEELEREELGGGVVYELCGLEVEL